MFRRVAQVAPVAALMAIGMPPYGASAVGTASLQSEDAIMLVREGDRWRGGWRRGGDDRWRFRGDDGWRFRRDDGWRFRGDDGRRFRRDDGWRFRRDDGWRFRGDDGWRAFREDGPNWHRFRGHRGLDDFGPLFGLGQRYFFGPRYYHFDHGYGGGRRRGAPWW